LYQQFSSEFSGPLEYTVGVSDWSTDWNYTQTSSIEPGTSWKWRVHFNLDSAPAADATLTIALAGSDHARMGIYVNDETRAVASFYPQNGGGNALIREGSHAKYSVSYVTIPSSRLNAGANTITLVQGSTGHVMYDYLNLEWGARPTTTAVSGDLPGAPSPPRRPREAPERSTWSGPDPLGRR
jgi:rhamnogalacturonan endolyase